MGSRGREREVAGDTIASREPWIEAATVGTGRKVRLDFSTDGVVPNEAVPWRST